MGRSRGRPSAVFCWGRCEAFQGGGALSRPISGIDKLIPAKSSFRSIPSLRSTAAARTACCGHGHDHLEASCHGWRYRSGNLSCFLNRFQHELLPHLPELRQGKPREQTPPPGFQSDRRRLPQDTCEDFEAWHYDTSCRRWLANCRHRCLRTNHRRSAEAVQVPSGA